MAQRTGEPQPFVASEGISASVPPTLTLTPTMPLSAPISHSLVCEAPLFSVGHWQTFTPPKLVTESILVTATRGPETLLTASSP